MGLKLGRTAVSHFLSQVAVSLSGFIATFAIARVLGAEGVGVYAVGMSIVVWLNVPLSGFQEALTKRISEGTEREEYLGAGVLLNVTSVGVPAVLVLAVDQHVNEFVGANVAELVALVLLTNGLFNTARDVLHGEKKVARAGWVRVCERIARTAGQVILLLLGYEIAGLFVGHALSLVLGTLIAVVFITLRPAVPDRHHFRRLYAYAKHGWSNGLKGNAFNYTDIIVLGAFVSASLVGIYSVAWTLASFLVVVANSISSTLFPEISDLSTDDRWDEVHHYLNEGLVFTGVFLIPGFFGAVAIGGDVLQIYDPEFTPGATILVILIVARTVDAYASQIISVVRALDRPDVALRIDLVFVAANLGLNAVLVYLYGWYGAAFATLLSGCFTLLLSYYSISRLIGAPEIPYREIGEEIAAGILMFISVWFFESIAPSGHHVTILLVFGGAAIYVGIIVIISPRIRQKAAALLS